MTDDIERRFKYHAPTPERRALHDEWREHVMWMARRIEKDFPHSRERSLALTKLEELSFWVHADIARQQYDEEQGSE